VRPEKKKRPWEGGKKKKKPAFAPKPGPPLKTGKRHNRNFFKNGPPPRTFFFFGKKFSSCGPVFYLGGPPPGPLFFPSKSPKRGGGIIGKFKASPFFVFLGGGLHRGILPWPPGPGPEKGPPSPPRFTTFFWGFFFFVFVPRWDVLRPRNCQKTARPPPRPRFPRPVVPPPHTWQTTPEFGKGPPFVCFFLPGPPPCFLGFF